MSLLKHFDNDSLFNWRCPHCLRDVTIDPARKERGAVHFPHGIRLRSIRAVIVVCPNEECKQVSAEVSFNSATRGRNGSWYVGDPITKWAYPTSSAKPYPDFIPEAIRSDYEEACLIRDLSPKASATLARRCLQGMIRDFWGVKAARLVDEINALQGKIAGDTWDAIDAVRQIGNIGAHMAKDINVIVDVDADEAALLIGLVETLLDDWYIAREERAQRNGALIAAAAAKKQIAKQAPAVAAPAPSANQP